MIDTYAVGDSPEQPHGYCIVEEAAAGEMHAWSAAEVVKTQARHASEYFALVLFLHMAYPDGRRDPGALVVRLFSAIGWPWSNVSVFLASIYSPLLRF